MRRAALAALFALGCSEESSDEAREPVVLPDLARAVDVNPDPEIFEVSLAARVAKKQYPGADPSAVWSYDGTVPGPLIEANQGDQLLVHFTNELPESTTIHWHGVRVPAAMDGTMAMQAAIEPGSGFEYAFTLKDAGLYWFHPHVRSDLQVEKGLYGTILVRGPDEPEVDAEEVLVLDDVRVLPDGTFPEFLDDESKMMGREGNVLMVNGAVEPEISLPAGGLARLRLVNTANGRFFNLRLEGHTLRVIGTDGGLVPKPWDTETLLLSPGERYDVVFVASGAPGETFTLWNEHYMRGHDMGHEGALKLATVKLAGSPLAGRALPGSFPEIERLPAGPVDSTIVLDEKYDDAGELLFTVNGQVFPDVTPLLVPNGALRVLRVQNDSDMDHPFHLHGFFFQLLGVDGVAVEPDSLHQKDTQIVRANSALELVSRFDEPGHWMYHCHILEHAEGGMMGEVRVE